jgi:nitrate reductase gamma subunit
MYAFLTGPMLWISFLVCIGGLAWRAVWYVRGLNWQLDRVPYGQYPALAFKGAARSILHWLIPFASKSWRDKPIFTLLFFALHLGLILVPLFLFGHAVLLKSRFGLGWPTLPGSLADQLTLASLAAAVGIAVRRFALPEVRILTTGQDILAWCLTVAPMLTGFVAAHTGGGEASPWLVAHVVAGELMLMALPFTKLSHVVLFFLSRAQIGMDFGMKRGGQKGRGLVW